MKGQMFRKGLILPIMLFVVFCPYCLGGKITESISELKKNSKVEFTNDYAKAKEKAAKEKKLVYVLISSDHCGWCKFMMKYVMTNDAFAELMNEYTVPVLLNRGVKEEAAQIKNNEEINLSGVPRQVFVDGEGKQVKTIYGAWTTPLWGLFDLNEVCGISSKRFKKLYKKHSKILKKKKKWDSYEPETYAAICQFSGKYDEALKIIGPDYGRGLTKADDTNKYLWFWCYFGKLGFKKFNKKGIYEKAQTVDMSKLKPYMKDTVAWCFFLNKKKSEAVAIMEEVAKKNADDKSYAEDLEIFKSGKLPKK